MQLTFLKRATLISILLIFGNVVSANSCEDSYNEINADIVTYNSTIWSKHLPWMDYSWLKEHMGTPVNILYEDGSYEFQVLCPHFQAVLTLSFDKQNNFIGITGKGFAGNFNIVRPGAKLHPSYLTVTQTDNAMRISSNETYKDTVRNTLYQYYFSLRNCIAGDFSHPIDNIFIDYHKNYLSVSSTIKGVSNNKCQVASTYYKGFKAGGVPQGCRILAQEEICYFSSESLAFFQNQIAIDFSNGQNQYPQDSEIIKKIATECRKVGEPHCIPTPP